LQINERKTGKNIFTQKDNLLDVSNLATGIYNLKISAEEKNNYQKAVVE